MTGLVHIYINNYYDYYGYYDYYDYYDDYYQRKLGSNTSVLRTNRILRFEMMKGGRSYNNT